MLFDIHGKINIRIFKKQRRMSLKKVLLSSIILISVIFGIIYLFLLKTSTFEKIVSVDKEKISSIKIKKNSEEINLTNKNEIAKIWDEFSKMKLRKENQSTKGVNESYWISIFENNDQTYGLTFYNSDFLIIYNFDTRKSTQYKITNVNELKIPNLF